MKKLSILLITVLLVTMLILTSCSKPEVKEVEAPTKAPTPSEEPVEENEENIEAPKYEDGVYFARDEIGKKWTYFVTVTVEGGKITDTYWSATNFVPAGDKRVLSENKSYGMVAYGSAQSYWYEQADAAEAWLIENQDPTAFEEFYTDEEGHTDALKTDGGASVSIKVNSYFSLVEKALSSEPVPAGNYGDTVVVTAKGEVGDKGWQELTEFIVVNGTIVAVDFDAFYANEYVAEGEDSNAKYFVVDDKGKATAQSKDQLKENYGMVAFGGSELEWYQQAELLEAYVVENQNIYALTEEGNADGIAGASIHANGFEALFNQAFSK